MKHYYFAVLFEQQQNDDFILGSSIEINEALDDYFYGEFSDWADKFEKVC